MATYVLVHGAWHGGWCWRDVAGPLRASGHQVLTPTLTGLGERAGELRPEVGLRTHVDDVVEVLRSSDLRDVVLVGHSYAGLVVREAADREPARIARLELVDAWVGPDGASMDGLAPEFFRRWVDATTTDGVIAVPPASTVGVTEPDQVAWLESRMTPHPRRSFADRTRLTGAADAIPSRAVLCVPASRIPFGEWARELGYPTVELESGHDAMVTAPGALAGLLQQDAPRPAARRASGSRASPTGRNRKVEQGEHTREALVTAAIALFAEKGFAETSTTEIVDRTGTTRGALYHHFADKHQLFEAALDAVEGDIFDRVRASGDGLGDDVRRRLAAGVDVFLDACLEPAVQRILLQEAPSVLGWERWQRLDRPRCARRLLAAGLGEAVDRGLIAAPSAPALTHLVYGALVQAGIVIAGADDPRATRTVMGETSHRLLGSLFRSELPPAT